MSGKKNRVRGKSGFLTGVMIVSTGLMAGFQGFEIAVSKDGIRKISSNEGTRPDGGRSPGAVKRQVNALDRLVTASLEQNTSGTGNDAAGLAALIEAARVEEIAVQNAADIYPVVNRALKRDRDMARNASDDEGNRRESLKPVIEPARKTAPRPPSNQQNSVMNAANAGQGNHRQPAVFDFQADAPVIAVSPPVKAAAKTAARPVRTGIPYADSADIALFAADMPLPSKLTQNTSRGNNGLPLLARAHRDPYNRSPLVPRKFVSGKAFGGLAERAFQKRERRCMTTALYFEARSEPESGQIAVGQVVMNRVRSPDYPDTICGVVYQGSHRRTGCQFSFTCDGKVDKPNNKTQWERSKRLANQVLEGQVWLKSIGHATHYHATYVKPRWRRKMARLKQIGRHIFYKSPNISVTDTYQRYTSGKRS